MEKEYPLRGGAGEEKIPPSRLVGTTPFSKGGGKSAVIVLVFGEIVNDRKELPPPPIVGED